MRIPIWFIVCLGIFVISSVPSSAGSASRPDGTFWQDLTDDQQTYATIGAIAGYQDGYTVALTTVVVAEDAALRANKTTWTYTGSLRHGEFSTHTVGYYKASITDFYQTHPKAIHKYIGGILECLSDSPTESCNQVAADAEKYAP